MKQFVKCLLQQNFKCSLQDNILEDAFHNNSVSPIYGMTKSEYRRFKLASSLGSELTKKIKYIEIQELINCFDVRTYPEGFSPFV